MSESVTSTLVDVPMPQMGVSVTEGTVLEWRVAVGDTVESDQVLCDISTDKVDSEVPSPVAGTFAEALVEPGTTVPVGTPIARIEATGPLPDGVVPSAGGPGAEDAAVPADAETGAEAAPAAAPPAPAQNGAGLAGSDRRRYSPVVQRIAETHAIDLARVSGSGRDGRVTKKDVLAYVEQQAGQPAAPAAPAQPAAAPAAPALPAPGEATTETLSRMRRAIAVNMLRSKQTAPHAHTWIEVDMSRVERLRKPLGVTALAFVARATIDALREHPALNAWLQGDERTLHADVNLGIAVALDGEGLIVPVIHRAQELSVEGLAARIRDLATRARAGQLGPDEVQGGTFTITNPGRFGSLMAAPIINQPQVAILDLEAIEKRPVVVTDEDGNDSLAIRPTSVFGLAWDHRAVDGALAARFLGTLREKLRSWPEPPTAV
jgi:pyruvate/2-oxoglutarate dehydrogenase complex dihydrolipoamide acyltransferase (E2) component